MHIFEAHKLNNKIIIIMNNEIFFGYEFQCRLDRPNVCSL